MSNHNWVCFSCRLAVRRPSQAIAARCAACREQCVCLGHKIPIPPRTKLRQWRDLRNWVFRQRGEQLLRKERMRVRTTHAIEQEIVRFEATPGDLGRKGTIRRLRQDLAYLHGRPASQQPLTMPLFLPPVFLKHAAVMLREEVARLARMEEEYANNWPEHFDPNDIAQLDLLLTGFLRKEQTGYPELQWNSKPLILFFRLVPPYVRSRGSRLPETDRAALLGISAEFESRLISSRRKRLTNHHP